jgi:hypothetical protein
MCFSKSSMGVEITMLRQTFSSLLVIGMISIGAGKHVAAAEGTGPRVVGEILPSVLADHGQTAQVRAFDIAPDGSAVAVLYASWGSSPHPVGAELWVAVWNISSDKLVWKHKLGADTTSGAARIHDVKDLIFTADQKYLLALAVKSAWCLDAKNGGTSVSIAPPADFAGTPIQISAMTGATAAITYSQDERSSFYTQLIDASSQRKITGWTTSAIPQSFSADGKLAVTVVPTDGAVDLQVIDTSSGRTLRTLRVAVNSGKGHSRESISAVARFFDDDHVVVAPSHRIDHSGKPPAYGLELIDVSNGQLVREISPQYFRPTGELVVSSDRNRFAVVSVYARERDVLVDSPRPKDLRVNLFVFSKGNSTPETAIPNVYTGLAGGGGEPLRLSSDGSVLAVSESPSGSIKVFQISAP